MRKWIGLLCQIAIAICYPSGAVLFIISGYSKLSKDQGVDGLYDYTMGILMIGIAVGAVGMAFYSTEKHKKDK